MVRHQRLALELAVRQREKEDGLTAGHLGGLQQGHLGAAEHVEQGDDVGTVLLLTQGLENILLRRKLKKM